MRVFQMLPAILTGVLGEEPARHSSGPTACLVLGRKRPLGGPVLPVGSLSQILTYAVTCHQCRAVTGWARHRC